jgi:hypothetical protein
LAFEFQQMTAAHDAIDFYRHVTGGRADETPQYGLALAYKMRPRLRWEAGLDISARDSPLASYNYQQNIARLGARITF